MTGRKNIPSSVDVPFAEASQGKPRPTGTALGSSSRHARYRSRILVFFAVMNMVSVTASPDGIAYLPFQYLLKDVFMLTPLKFAATTSLLYVPVYLGFIIGSLRDRLSRRRYGDPVILAASAAATSLAFVTLSAILPVYRSTIALMLAAMVGFVFIRAVLDGLAATVGKARGMTGSLAAITSAAGIMFSVISMIMGGWLTEHASYSTIFRLAALVGLGLIAGSFWRRGAITNELAASALEHTEAREAIIRDSGASRSVLWIAVLILFLYVFSPGWGTPLFYFLTTRDRLTPVQYGLFQGVLIGSRGLSTLLYYRLCKRFTLRQLLIAGTILASAVGPIFLFMNTAGQAFALAAVAGLGLGVAYASYWDLLLRVSPAGREGFATSLGAAIMAIGAVASDLLGARVYELAGFGLPLAMTTVCTLLILPCIWLLPRSIVEKSDRVA